MTIDETIEALQKLREEHGGKIEVKKIEYGCHGDYDIEDIKIEILYKKINSGRFWHPWDKESKKGEMVVCL